MANKSNSTNNANKNSTAKKNSSVNKNTTKKNSSVNNTTVKKNEKVNKIVDEDIIELTTEENDENGVIIKFIITVLVIAIIAFMFIKACSKDNTENVNKKSDKYDEEVIEKVEEESETQDTSTESTYYYVQPVSNIIEETDTTNNIVDSSDDTEIIEEEKDTEGPVISGIEDNEIYESVNINAADAVSDSNNLIVTIDDEDYNLGDPYNKQGKHKIKVTDEAGNTTEKEFVIAKIITNEEEYNDAMEDEENEVIAFNNDFEISTDSLKIRRSVKIMAKANVILTMGFEINEEQDTCELDDKVIEFENVTLNRFESYNLNQNLEYNFGIIVSDTCKVEVILNNTTINIKGNNAHAIMTVGHRENTKITMNNSKINNLNEEEDDNNITSGIYLFDNTEGEVENNINIDKSEFNDLRFPVLISKNLEEKTEVEINDSNITEEDVYILENNEDAEETPEEENNEEDSIENLE